MQISILDRRAALANEVGNVLVIDATNVGLHWDSRDRLVIQYPAGAQFFHQETKFKGVAVSYRTNR